MAVFETEEERQAREAEEARARFGSRDLLAPIPAATTAKVQSSADAVYGDSPAAQLFRRKTAQIAPSAPMATGFERNPVKFNNELHRPAPPRRDLLALPASPREEAPALRAPRGSDSPRDLLRLPDQDADLDREIDQLRRKIVNWKPTFFGGLVGQHDRKKYEAAREGLQQLEEQRAHRQRRAAGSGPEKPFEVDGALGFRNPDGTLRWERPPAREKEAKEPPAPSNIGEFTTKSGKRVFAMRDHTGKITYEEAPFDLQAPRDPDADYNRRETDREERDRKREEDREKREAEKERKANEAAAKRLFTQIDLDHDKYPNIIEKNKAKRDVAASYGVPDPTGRTSVAEGAAGRVQGLAGASGPGIVTNLLSKLPFGGGSAEASPQPAAPARGPAPAPISSHGPAAAPSGGGVIKMVRDASGRLVPQRG